MAISDGDRRLLFALSENARMPIAVLARRLGLSRTTVQARLDRLEEEGVIAGYSVKLSESYLGSLVRAHVNIVLAEKALGRVVSALKGLPQITAVHSVSGSFDLIAEVAAPSIRDLDQTIDAIGELDGVARTQSSVILSTRFAR